MSLINTRMQNMRSDGRLDKYEIRPSRYGALDLFATETNNPTGIITPELADKAKVSIGSTLQTPVIDYDGGISISGSRSVTIGDSENTSNLVTIGFSTYSWGFTIVPAMYMNNEISMQRDFEAKFNKYLYKFASTLDVACAAALAANKTKVFNDKLNYWTMANTLVVGWNKRNNILSDLNPLMSANDFFGQMHIVGNAGIESLIKELSKEGLYNDKNQQLSYSDKVLHFTNNVTNNSDTFGTGYAVNEGSVGLLTRFEREAILGAAPTADGHVWGIETLPLLNLPCGTYFYESVGDYNAIAGAATADMTRVRKEHYGFSVDIAYVVARNSAPNSLAAPIMRFRIEKETAS